MTRRNTPLEVEQVEQLALIARLLPHHGESPSLISQADGITVRQFSRALFQQHRSNPVLRVFPPHVRLSPDSVAKLFWAPERATLIQEQRLRRNIDSKNPSPRFDYCASAVSCRVLQQNRHDSDEPITV